MPVRRALKRVPSSGIEKNDRVSALRHQHELLLFPNCIIVFHGIIDKAAKQYGKGPLLQVKYGMYL
jgi:hypothetical protein